MVGKSFWQSATLGLYFVKKTEMSDHNGVNVLYSLKN